MCLDRRLLRALRSVRLAGYVSRKHSSSGTEDTRIRILQKWINFIKFLIINLHYIFSHGATAPSGSGPPHYRDIAITLRHITLGRTSLDEWSARRRDFYLTTIDIYKRYTSMPLAEFEPAIPASERPQTHALDRAATGDRRLHFIVDIIC